VDITFAPRTDSLEPAAVIGTGAVARTLAQRLLRLADADLAALRGVAGDGLIALLGDAGALPWVDGVVYLGHDADAPRLLLPTTLRPTMAADVFERAIVRHAGLQASPWAILAAPPRVIPLGDALPVERFRVLHWLGARP
jgi:MoxR-vWA-beta-propeller ternary system domain bpX5